MVDPVSIEADRIKKEKGIVEAVKYLSGQARCFPYYTKEFYQYYFKSLDYSLEDSELYTEVESSLSSLIETLDKKNMHDEYYEKACIYLFNYYIRVGNGNKAMITNSRIVTKTYPHTPGYLFKLKESFERKLLAARFLTTSQHKKNVEDIFDLLMIMFMDIAWHLSCDLKFNMEAYYANNRCKDFKRYKLLPYKRFGIYNNIKQRWDIEYIKQDESAIYDYFDDYEVDTFKDAFKDYSSGNVLMAFYHYYFELYPQALHFLPEHLTLEFDDLDSFGKHFEKYFDENKICTSDMMTDMNYIMFSKAVGLSHEFEKKYLKQQ